MKGHVCDSFYIKCPEWVNLQRQKVDFWLPRTGGRSDSGKIGGIMALGHGVSFGGYENVLLELIVVMATQLCKYIRSH